MDLTRTDDDLVTRLALARAVRGLSHATLASRLQVDTMAVYRLERGEGQIRGSLAKRAGLALPWRWQDLLLEPIPHEKAWAMLAGYRKTAAGVNQGRA